MALLETATIIVAFGWLQLCQCRFERNFPRLSMYDREIPTQYENYDFESASVITRDRHKLRSCLSLIWWSLPYRQKCPSRK